MPYSWRYDGKSTPASVDTKLQTFSNTAAMQVALDAALALRDGRLDAAEFIAALQAARFQTAAQVASAIATALLPYTDATGLQAAGYQTAVQVTSAIGTALCLTSSKRDWTPRWRSGTAGWMVTTQTSSPCSLQAPLPRPPT